MLVNAYSLQDDKWRYEPVRVPPMGPATFQSRDGWLASASAIHVGVQRADRHAREGSHCDTSSGEVGVRERRKQGKEASRAERARGVPKGDEQRSTRSNRHWGFSHRPPSRIPSPAANGDAALRCSGPQRVIQLSPTQEAASSPPARAKAPVNTATTPGRAFRTWFAPGARRREDRLSLARGRSRPLPCARRAYGPPFEHVDEYMNVPGAPWRKQEATGCNLDQECGGMIQPGLNDDRA